MVRISTIFDSELNQRMFLIMGDLVRIVATSIELDANKYTGKYKESVTLTATVTDKDSNPVGGVTVSFYNMNSRIGASVTNSNGVATFNYELTRDLSANARVDDLTSNTVGIELIHDYNMDVVLDKSIIQTGETATFTTTLTDNNIPLSGENITYTYNGITEYVTTLDGEAKLPYTGTGKGDVEFVIKYSNLLQETFVVEDCIFYHTDAITINIPTDNHKTIIDLSTLSLPSKFVLSMDYKTNCESRCGLFSKSNFSGNPNYSVFIGSPNGSSSWYYGGRTTATNTSDVSGEVYNYHNYIIQRDENNFYYQRDGTGNYNKNYSWFDNYSYVLGMMGWGTNNESTVKNIKLKAL